MARIAGVTLPEGKRIDIGLTAIFGIGRNISSELLSKAKIDPAKRVRDLSAEETTKLQKLVDQHPTEGSLRQKVADNIKRLKTTGAYRGIRHGQGLPTRGQRTRSNARTLRGKRKTIGAMRKKDMAKLGGVKKEKGEEE